MSNVSDVARDIALQRESSQPSPEHTTPATATRALRSRAAGDELAELDHEPERQLRTRRQSLSHRLELGAEEQPILQETHEQQEGGQRGPESLGENWIYIEEVVRGIVDQASSEGEANEPNSEVEPEEEAQTEEGFGEGHFWTMDEGNAGYGYQGPRFEFGMCTYDKSDNIRMYIGANRRKYMLYQMAPWTRCK